MDAIIDRLVMTIHSEGGTRMQPDELRAVVTACVSAMKGEMERTESRRADVTPGGAYRTQIQR